MLRSVVKEQEKVLYPRRYFPKIPDPFTPEFMKALEQETEANGLVGEAAAVAFEHIKENTRTENHMLDEIWEKGINKGFRKGVAAAHVPYKNLGHIEGFIHGLGEAETFKNPLQIFDLTNKTFKPFATGGTPEGLAGHENLKDGDFTQEHKPWLMGYTTKKDGKETWKPLNLYKRANEAAFTYNDSGTRLSLNLTKLARNKDILKGYESYEQHRSDGKIKPDLRPVSRSPASVLSNAMGKSIEIPEQIYEIPPRPEPTLAKLSRAEEIFTPQKTRRPELHKMLEFPIRKPVGAPQIVEMPTNKEINEILEHISKTEVPQIIQATEEELKALKDKGSRLLEEAGARGNAPEFVFPPSRFEEAEQKTKDLEPDVIPLPAPRKDSKGKKPKKVVKVDGQ